MWALMEFFEKYKPKYDRKTNVLTLYRSIPVCDFLVLKRSAKKYGVADIRVEGR